MKLSKVINMLWNKHSTSSGPLSEHGISLPSSSWSLSLENQIALIRQPGGWQANIGEKVLSTLVRLPHWPAGRTISVNEDNREVCRYGTGGRMTEPSGPQDIMLVHTAGYYQSAREYHDRIEPDDDSLFRAVIHGLGENIYASSTEMTQQVISWRARVADFLLEQDGQERNQPLLADPTEISASTENAACRGKKRRGDMDINSDVPTKKKSVNYKKSCLSGDINKCLQGEAEICKMYFLGALKKFNDSISCLQNPQINITQTRITELEITLFSLYEKVTSQLARNSLKAWLHALNREINTSQREIVLTIYPRHPELVNMPYTGEEPIPDDTAARVHELLRPERWPLTDVKIQRTQFPDLFSCFALIVESVEKRQTLSPRQIAELEIKFWFLYYQLQSAVAKNYISRALYKLQNTLNDSGQGLKLSFSPGYIYKDNEFSLAIKSVDLEQQKFIKKNLDTWPQQDRLEQQKIFPNFTNALKKIRTLLKNHDGVNFQKRITLFESNLISLYQQMRSQQAQDDITKVWCEVNELIRQSGRNLILLHPPENIDSRKNTLSDSAIEVYSARLNFTRETISIWPEFDQRWQRTFFPELAEKFILIKEEIQQSDKDFYQQWIDIFEKRVFVLYGKVISKQAKYDIINMFHELGEVIQQSGRSLVLQQFHGMTEHGSDMLFPEPVEPVQKDSAISHTVTSSESVTEGYSGRETAASREEVARSGSGPQSVAEPEALPDLERILELVQVPEQELAQEVARLQQLLREPVAADNLLLPDSPSGPEGLPSLERILEREQVPEQELVQEVARLQQLLSEPVAADNLLLPDSPSGPEALPDLEKILEREQVPEQELAQEVARLQQLLSTPVPAENLLASGIDAPWDK